MTNAGHRAFDEAHQRFKDEYVSTDHMFLAIARQESVILLV